MARLPTGDTWQLPHHASVQAKKGDEIAWVQGAITLFQQ